MLMKYTNSDMLILTMIKNMFTKMSKKVFMIRREEKLEHEDYW